MFVVTGAAGVGAGTLDAEVCAAGDAEHDEAGGTVARHRIRLGRRAD